MIQRIQSLYLLLSSACLILMNYFNISVFTNDYSFNLKGLFKSDKMVVLDTWNNPSLAWVGATLIAFNFVIMFLFKNRKLQLLFGRIQYAFILAYVVLLYYSIDKIAIALQLDEPKIAYGAGIYLPVVALVFNFLANRAIKKDEALVKSLDRLR